MQFIATYNYYIGELMQTFLPLESIPLSMTALDDKRLGKQRVEALQIIKALTIDDYGWKNHPCVKMWDGHLDWLKYYMKCAIKEWIRRGFKNTMIIDEDYNLTEDNKPNWLGDDRVHGSHRANLIRKDPKYYSKHKWTDDPSTPYYWAGFGKGESE